MKLSPLTKAELASVKAQEHAESAASRAAEQRELAERAKRNGMKRRRVRAPDGTVKEVWCYSSSYHAMGFQDHQIAAAERFSKDWEIAYRGLQGQGFEPGVDGGRSNNAVHANRVMAQQRLALCKQNCGHREYEIIVGVVIYGATITGIAKESGVNNVAVRKELDSVFNKLAGFYGGHVLKDATWEAYEKWNKQCKAMIERAEREAG